MFRNYIRTSLALGLFCLILLCPLLLWAQTPAPRPHTYVNDPAGILKQEDIAALNEQIHALEEAHSVQLAIVLVKRLPDNVDIADFARDIGRKWHVGINDSGLVYVASISQHQQRLEVARNLEGVITDIASHDITDHLKPYFREKNYAGGLMVMISEIKQRLEPAADYKYRL
jgi:uncharacterized protein